MSKDKLDIDERNYVSRIGWWIAEDGDFGLFLGNIELSTLDDASETRAACDAIRSLPQALQPMNIQNDEWEWDSRTAATKALRTARAAMKLVAENRPLPAWAATALANGWKPPKGWKP
jgi:hypothetical protein